MALEPGQRGGFGGRSLADHQPLPTTLWQQAPVTLLLILYTLAIALAVFSVNLFADALRDLLDPITSQSSGGRPK